MASKDSEGRSAALQRFIDSLEAKPKSYAEFVQYSELDVSALDELDGRELAMAQNRLIEWLKDNADVRAARVLAGFDSKEATEGLRDVVRGHANSPYDDGLAAGAALRGLIRRGDVTDPIAEVRDFYLKAGRKGRRLALTTLAEQEGVEARQALEAGLDDEDEDNRRVTAKLLLAQLGLERHVEVDRTTYALLPAELSATNTAVRARAKAKLRQLADAVARDGVPPVPQAPPPSEDLNRFLESMRDDSAPDFDLDALTALAGVERDWMEYALIAQLEGGDPRIPRALSALGSTVALESLRGSQNGGNDAFQRAVAEAIERLQR